MYILETAYNHPIAAVSIISLITAFISRKFREIVLRALQNIPLIFVRKTYLHRSLGDAFIAYLMKNGYKVKRFSGELYGEDPAFIRSENEVRHILYRDHHSNSQLFWGKGWPILISGTPLVHTKDYVKNYSYIVYTFRWSVDIISLLDCATEGKNDKSEEMEVNHFVVKRVSGGRFFKEKNPDAVPKVDSNSALVSEYELADPFSAVMPVKWEKSNIGQLVYHNSLEMMSLNPELEELLEEVQFWYRSQEWYEERGIPWKRGLLFYGKPGTGKTMFTRALAEKLNMPLIIFDLASMNNTEFMEAWNQILPKRIVLFEDFDAVFHKRKNIANSELTFDCILNCLDGADKKQGILAIITTNHPETLDHALGGPIDSIILETEDHKWVIIDKDTRKVVENNGVVFYDTQEAAQNALRFNGGKIPTRPGRIDRSIEFLPLDRPGRLKLAMRIMKDEKLAEKMVNEGENDSAAQLQERCFRAAVEMLFAEKGNKKQEHIPVQE